MRICIIHRRDTAREVLSRALAHRLRAEVAHFSCVENVLVSSLNYDVFIVYNNFQKKMNGVRGVKEIRSLKPAAYIIGVSSIPNFQREFLPAGANAFLLLSGNEIAELADLIQRHVKVRVAVDRAYGER